MLQWAKIVWTYAKRRNCVILSPDRASKAQHSWRRHENVLIPLPESMEVENDIEFLDNLVYTKTGKRLNSLQKAIIRGTWQNLKYPEISKTQYRSAKYVKGVGFNLWKLLSELLVEDINQSNFRAIMEKRELLNIERSTFAQDSTQINFANSVNICSEILHFSNFLETEAQNQEDRKSNPRTTNTKDLSEMPNLLSFYGRTQELTTLKKLLLQEKCRLLTILGISGIGKTALVVKLIEQIADDFDYILWRSLRNKPSLDILERSLLEFFSTTANIDSRSHLIDYLRKHRCLIILDNVQMIFQSGELAGNYETGYEDYASLFRQIGESEHSSCLVLISGDKPREVADLESENQHCKSLPLAGLDVDAAWEILREQGFDTKEKWQYMINQYGGNPLWLKMVAKVIHDLGFTDLWQQGSTFLFADLEYKLSQQVNRLSAIEKKVISAISELGDRVTTAQILAYVPQSELLNALQSLLRRSLIERHLGNGEVYFTIQPVIREYLTHQLEK